MNAQKLLMKPLLKISKGFGSIFDRAAIADSCSNSIEGSSLYEDRFEESGI